MARLYVVTTEIEVVVRAESLEKACEIAADQRASDLLQSRVAMDWRATEMMYLPGDWDLDCQPYGDIDSGGNMLGTDTIRELIEAGEAPVYVAQQALVEWREKRNKAKT